ncbi:methyl-accepting chemotaxis protein [Candidatus Thiodictyon syntrophicum]|jgi:hypothetical protein|uniref:Methyl-accepting transducer domain-containing protein n=1 Tax=Candidatus Thiodictyon syntrophicum TaxID=1166950 RepID=A0A2K8U6V0_9GAMM|nr:methyl-accepting chemotaxis protein [Candidatus Thiodictyon syntrophicum]AUB81275.1 hypothetical protein THSYN_10125 [Candidatus Thiodictyon syntrophicum]
MAIRTKTGAGTADGTAPVGTAAAVTISLWLCLALGAGLALTSVVLTWDLDARILSRSRAAAAAQVAGRQLVHSAAAALQGDEGAFAQLRGERDHVQSLMDGLTGGVPLPPGATPMATAQGAWLAYREAADRILAAQDAIVGVRAALAATTPLLNELAASMAKSAELMAAQGAPAGQVLEAGWQLARIATMRSDFRSLPGIDGAPPYAGDPGTVALATFGASLQTLVAEAGARAEAAAGPSLQETAQLFEAVRLAADPIAKLAPQAQPVLTTLEPMQADAQQFAAALDPLVAGAWRDPRTTRLGPLPVGPWSAPVYGALALVSALLLALRALRRREGAARRRGERDAAAALVLRQASDSPPADGSADGFDDRLERGRPTGPGLGADEDGVGGQLRLHHSIDATAGKLMASVAQTRAEALHLREAAAVQAGQIALLCGAVQTLIADLDALGGQAAASAGAATQAAAVARRGIQMGREALAGMAAAGGRFHAGSEYLTRCGETAQTLAALLERLADSVDESNILALNAAMQAARAEEAGHDCTVFAEEVLRVAGASGDSTGQGQALVRTLQSDLAAAWSSLQTGSAAAAPVADLLPQAGEALTQIETAGVAGADLVRGVADAIQRQSQSLTDTLQPLRAITAQNAQGIRGLVQAHEDLVTVAAELQGLAAALRMP